MTEKIRTQLQEIAKQLGGTVEYLDCCDLKTQHKKVVIKYAESKR